MANLAAPAVREFLAAIDAGARDRARDLLSRDAIVAIAAGEDHLRATHAFGPEALERVDPGPITTVGQAVDRAGVWFGELARDRTTVIVSAALDRSGLIGRLLMFEVPLVDRVPVSGMQPGRPVRRILEPYFAALQDDRFEDAAAQFAVDCLYSHPPYRAGGDRVEFRGREALVDGLRRERGSSPARQIVLNVAQRGAVAFIEGKVEGIHRGGTFVSALSLDGSGLITRYVACYGAPRVPAAAVRPRPEPLRSA